MTAIFKMLMLATFEVKHTLQQINAREIIIISRVNTVDLLIKPAI